MTKGFNSDVEMNGYSFHVQTEDWGAQNQYIVTQVFRNGAVIKNVRRSYGQLFGPTKVDERAVRLAMKEQHQLILDRLSEGQLNFIDD